ncbi:MAG TPA: SpoIIE family protein phosphatase [Solirubrobacterales bacterium]
MSWVPIAVESLVALAAVGLLLFVLVTRERRVRRRFRTLAEIAAVSDAGESLEETFDAICDILVPELADFCMIDVIEDGDPRRVAVRVGPGGDERIERGLRGRPPSVPLQMFEAPDSAALKPRFFERMTDDDLRALAHDESDLKFLQSLGVRSAVTVALNARGRITGTLTMGVAWSGRRYVEEDARFAWILSGRVALALDNSGLFAELERAERARAEIGETLQRGLLPPPLPHIAGWSIAAIYRPAGVENEVGGDFYDAFRLPGGGWMLVIGDVTGRGARAASITAVARYTLRTAASLTADPLRALSTLNRALLARGDSALCSLVALAISDDPTRPVSLAVAGHPPPLLVGGEAVVEATEAGPLLGAFADAGWSIAAVTVEPGQQLVIVTDGVTEAHGGDDRFGEARLHSVLRGARGPGQVVQRLESALSSFTGGTLDDDVAILAISRAGIEVGTRQLGSPRLAAVSGPQDSDE